MTNKNKKDIIEPKQSVIDMYNAIASIEILTKPGCACLRPKFVNHKCEKTCLGYRVSANVIY